MTAIRLCSPGHAPGFSFALLIQHPAKRPLRPPGPATGRRQRRALASVPRSGRIESCDGSAPYRRVADLCGPQSADIFQ